MKKITLFIISIFLYLGASAQLKVATNGIVGIGSQGTMSGKNLYVYGSVVKFEYSRPSYGYNPTLTFEFYNAGPRIYANNTTTWGHQVVFYNSPLGDWDDIQVKTCYEYSDKNGKTNINPLSNALETVMKLEGVSYYWKNDSLQKNKISGFLAQDVEKVIPGAIIKDDTVGHYLMSYSRIIPYLCEAIKEQQKQIETLQDIVIAHEEEIIALKQQNTNITTEGNSSTQKSANVATGINSPEPGDQESALFQNMPNPFQNDTEIKYQLSTNIQEAKLYIYDLQGKEIKSFSISGTGMGSVIIKGNELEPGMYIYSLVVDKQLIDTKRMILTK